MKQRSPYNVPDGYFDRLQGEILSKTIYPPGKVNSLRPQVRWRAMAGFAAGFALFVSISWGGFSLIMSGSYPNDSLTADNTPLIDGLSNDIVLSLNEATLLDLMLEDRDLIAEEVVNFLELNGGLPDDDYLTNQQ